MSKAFAVLGLFPSADALMQAIPAVRKADLGRVEAYTPYPIEKVLDVTQGVYAYDGNA